VIWGDDIGWSNVSAYGMGVMGYTTPNIDRIAIEGIRFTDHYAQPSCTAGRAAFITGQYPLRVGLSTVGLPGSPISLSAEDPTLAQFLKPLGYRTGQFGKNHLGDRNEHLPTVHGFDGWQENRSWAIGPAMSLVFKFVDSFKDYPARQASFSPDTSAIVEMMMSTAPQ
jgi:arylsulfatase A-like enzyme